jgi:mono/diheme cytochrome c family protein
MKRVLVALLPSAFVLACVAFNDPQLTDPEQTAASSEKPNPMLAEIGEERFQRYCVSCHGADARGTGPVADALQTPPADLRRISARHGSAFPDAEIARTIDGRFSIAAHGPREMPVWGKVFGSGIPESETADSIARGQVDVLVEYLKSIQDPPDAPASPEEIRTTMGEIFSAVRVLLPLSLSEQGFDESENEVRVRGALAVLDSSAAELSRHGASKDVAFAHLARSLAIDARDIRLRYDAGHRDQARYLIQELTETCAACHSRLPSGSAPLSAEFISGVAVVELPLEQRAQLAFATRQFDVALETYEEMLTSRQIRANDLHLGGHLVDYLELLIRVRRDRDRAADVLAQFGRRDDLSPALADEVKNWSSALASLPAAKPRGSEIAVARQLATQPAGPLNWEGADRLIENLEASSLLHRALEGGLPRTERAEAYYLLGLIETRIGRSYWRSEAEAYLETAIRMAPGEPVAADAYSLLEEFLVSGFTGSAGTQIPPDIDQKLDALRRIAEGA